MIPSKPAASVGQFVLQLGTLKILFFNLLHPSDLSQDQGG